LRLQHYPAVHSVSPVEITHKSCNEQEAKAVARIADRTASQQTI